MKNIVIVFFVALTCNGCHKAELVSLDVSKQQGSIVGVWQRDYITTQYMSLDPDNALPPIRTDDEDVIIEERFDTTGAFEHRRFVETDQGQLPMDGSWDGEYTLNSTKNQLTLINLDSTKIYEIVKITADSLVYRDTIGIGSSTTYHFFRISAPEVDNPID